MVEIRGVSKSFHKTVKEHTTEVKALADVSLSIRENEFISIIGPSGCGKTTLLKMIDGLIPYDSGKILIDGKQVTAPGPDRAVVFQAFALLPWRTVLANVEFSLELRQIPKEERAKTARDYLKRVGLADFENHYPHELSGGMQQRAGLARALAVNPSILLMDEPFGAVDAQTRQLLQEELLELWQRERKTVIFITHSMDEAVYLSDRVVVMTPRPGKVAEILDVPLARPRVSEEVRRDSKFVDLTNYIWESLKKAMEKPSLNSRVSANFLSFLSLAILWEIAGRSMDSTLIPPLSQIGAAWWKLLSSGKLLSNLSMSLTTLAIGFCLAVVIGVVLGLLMGRFRAVEHFLDHLCQRADVGAEHRVRARADPVVRSRRGIAHRGGVSLRGVRHHHQHHDRGQTGRQRAR